MSKKDFSRPCSRQPIPLDAKLAFSGVLFDVYQWEQRQYDGTKKIFEKIRRPDTVYVLPVTQEGRLLISHQFQPDSNPYYGFLGGRVEQNEDVLSAAKRELSEEAGITASSLELWKSFQFLPKIEWAIYIFIGKGLSYHDSQLDSGEKIELLEVSINELFDIVSRDTFGDVELALLLLRVLRNESELAQFKALIN